MNDLTLPLSAIVQSFTAVMVGGIINTAVLGWLLLTVAQLKSKIDKAETALDFLRDDVRSLMDKTRSMKGSY